MDNSEIINVCRWVDKNANGANIHKLNQLKNRIVLLHNNKDAKSIKIVERDICELKALGYK